MFFYLSSQQEEKWEYVNADLGWQPEKRDKGIMLSLVESWWVQAPVCLRVCGLCVHPYTHILPVGQPTRQNTTLKLRLFRPIQNNGCNLAPDEA